MRLSPFIKFWDEEVHKLLINRARKNVSEDRLLLCDLLILLFLKASTTDQCWRRSLAGYTFIQWNTIILVLGRFDCSRFLIPLTLARTRAITVACHVLFPYRNGRSLSFYRIKARCLSALNGFRGSFKYSIFPFLIAFIKVLNWDTNSWRETSCFLMHLYKEDGERIW